MLIDTFSDHELFLALKCQETGAWRYVWDHVVQAECEVRRNAEMIRKALQRHEGNRKEAANELGISERTIYRKLAGRKNK